MMIADITHRVLGDSVSIIITLRMVFGVSPGGDFRVIPGQGGWIPIISRAHNRPIISVKAPLERPIVSRAVRSDISRDVPFAHRVVTITRGAQNLRNGNTTVIQLPLVSFTSPLLGHVPDPG